MLTKLKNKKIGILAADGFEKVELTLPKAALETEGATVEIISLHKGKIRGMNLHMPASRMDVDKVISEVKPDDYDGLLIPGGFINPDLLRQSAAARDFVKSFDETKKPIASLCHGTWVLASAGLLGGRTLTSWPGIRDDMVNAGATWLNEQVVYDGNLVTSRGPQDLPYFIPAMIRLFDKGHVSEQLNTQYEESDPAATEAPILVQQSINWISRLPVKLLTGIAAVGLKKKLSH